MKSFEVVRAVEVRFLICIVKVTCPPEIDLLNVDMTTNVDNYLGDYKNLVFTNKILSRKTVLERETSG